VDAIPTGCRRAIAALVCLLLTGTVSAQPTDRFIDVGGLSLHYVDWGGAGRQPMILLHGIGRVARTFDHVAPHFSEDYHVMAVDMRGHGDSGWDPDGGYLVEDYVSDIEAMVEQLGLENLVLWGNSTGGRVAQVFAGKHPELVGALIVEDVGPERPASIANSLAERIRREQAGWDSEDALLDQLRRSSPRTQPEVLRAYAHYGSTVRAEDGRTIFKRDPRINDGFVVTDLWRFVRAIRAPTIYVLGGASTIVSADTQRELLATLPDVRIEIMPGLGHYPSEESPADFLAIVDPFLSANRP